MGVTSRRTPCACPLQCSTGSHFCTTGSRAAIGRPVCSQWHVCVLTHTHVCVSMPCEPCVYAWRDLSRRQQCVAVRARSDFFVAFLVLCRLIGLTHDRLDPPLVLSCDLRPVLGAHQHRCVVERRSLEPRAVALNHSRRQDWHLPRTVQMCHICACSA